MLQSDLDYTRIQKEIELAQRIQVGLLPKQPPVVAGLDIWAGFRPANQIGGDFYDFIIGRNRNLTMVVGDICGKGVSAAMLMPMTRMVIRTAALGRHNHTPRDIVNRSNSLLYEDYTNTDMFATTFVGNFNPFNQTIVFANAGHSPVIYIPFGQSAQLLLADEAPIGVLQVCAVKNQRIQLKRGDVLIIGTDGLVEDYNLGIDLTTSYNWLLRKLELLVDRSARSVAETLFGSLQDLSRAEGQKDDQTLVVIKCV